MSLNWDLSEVKNYEQTCFYEAREDDPNHGVTKGDRMLNPVTNALIWATMQVDLPGITEENAPEFFARLRFTELFDGPMLIRAVGEDGKRPDRENSYLTEGEVLAHVGLRCNVTKKSRVQWLRRWDRELEQLASSYERKRERAEEAVKSIRFE
jgi:hypothetical protein